MSYRRLSSALVLLLSLAVSCDALFSSSPKNVKVYRIWESMKEEAKIVVPKPNAKGNFQDFLDLIESKVSFFALFCFFVITALCMRRRNLKSKRQGNHCDSSQIYAQDPTAGEFHRFPILFSMLRIHTSRFWHFFLKGAICL
jgi:hypothetical protein